MSEEATTETTTETGGTENAEAAVDAKDVLYPEGEQAGEGGSTESKEESKAEDAGEEPKAEETEAEGDESKEGEDKPEGDKETDEGDDKAEVEAVKVEDLEFPEGVVSEEKVTEFVDLVNKLDDMTPKERAQALIDMQQGIYAAQFEAHEAKVEAWGEETKADKDIGGDKLEENLAIAAKARDEFGGEELTKVLNETGVGNHPAFVKFFYNIGKAISDDSFVQGSAGSAKTEKSKAEILYGQSK